MRVLQAARGAPISTASTAPVASSRGVWSAGRARAVALGVAVVGVIADQAAKAWALHALTPGVARPFVGPLLQLRLVRNPGAAFSLGTGSTWVFTLLAVLALGFLLGYVVPRVRVRGWSIALGLLLAGIAGNLIDRLVRPPAVLRGHVIDFLELPHWPIFNVADMCITTAAVLLVALSLFGRLGYDGASRADESSQEA